MREIKFRAWDSEKQTMIHDSDQAVAEIYNLKPGSSIHNTVWRIGMHFKTLMQYTGLKDKNGVDIYEGDLLRIPAKDSYEEHTFNCFEVFYHSNECIGGQNIGFCINRMHPQGNSGGGHGYKFTPESINKNGFIVIGNIHENPELLEPTL